jgi:hypothetical protein
MAKTFEPNLSILQPSQRMLWDELVAVPREFVLCGGTAIALRLGHRQSVDFDFVARRDFDPDEILENVKFLVGCRTVQKSASTLTCVVDRNGPVQLSFFGAPSVRLTHAAEVAAKNQVRVAALVDLAGMKAAVVQKRAEAKDYLDVDALIQTAKIGLPTALGAARAIYGESFNPELTLRSLSYFGDGTLPTLPREVQDRLAAAVSKVDLLHLPAIELESE